MVGDKQLNVTQLLEAQERLTRLEGSLMIPVNSTRFLRVCVDRTVNLPLPLSVSVDIDARKKKVIEKNTHF
jgi:hypothetical protein